jgi:thymidylate synthase ThyX
MNLREFFNFLDLRLDPHAQWEIRELAEEMFNQVLNYNDEWYTILSYWRETCFDK